MRILTLVLITFLLSSCFFRQSRAYNYDVDLKSPTTSDSLVFEDDRLKLRFGIEEKLITVMLQNKTQEELMLNWNDVSFVWNGSPEGVVSLAGMETRAGADQPVVIVAPGAELLDAILPAKSITSSGTIKNIFPKYDFGSREVRKGIERIEGAQFQLNMPITINGQRIDYRYDFSVESVRNVW